MVYKKIALTPANIFHRLDPMLGYTNYVKYEHYVRNYYLRLFSQSMHDVMVATTRNKIG